MINNTIVELFSGCGGFGLGAELAGFHSHLAIDIDPTLQSAYRLNFPNTNTVISDIGALDDFSWRLLLKGMRPDGVIGGPPCQGFSRMGKRDQSDPRNSLIGHFFRHVRLLDPKFFVMENVEGILDEGNADVLMTAIQTVIPRFRVLDPLIVTASDFGAPTSRTRVVVVGFNPNEMEPLSLNDLLPSPDLHKVTVKDAISDLPPPIFRGRGDEDFSWAEYKNFRGKKFSDYAREMRRLPREGLGWDVALERLKKRQSAGHEGTVHSKPVKARYGALALGKIDKISKAKRLEWTGVCPTLRAGTGAEKGSHQAVRPIHPTEPRVITVREAARLQGFPDWFVFHTTKWHSFRMIGNSVSPAVSKSLLNELKQKLVLRKVA